MTDTVEKKFVFDASKLSRYTPGREAPIWWGILGLILIELTVVSAFVMSYFYLQMRSDEWPPAGVSVPDAGIPTLSVIILLISCGTMYLASKAIEKNQVNRFVICTMTSVALACVVLIIRWQQFQLLDFRWDEHVYGSLVWTLSGFHFIHVVSAAIGTFVIGLAGIAGYFNRQRMIGVVVDTMYWNFVGLAWIPFYFVLYWAPRIF